MKLVNERAKQEEGKKQGASEVAFLYLYIASGRCGCLVAWPLPVYIYVLPALLLLYHFITATIINKTEKKHDMTILWHY
jgi:hypothetical protein